MNYSGIIQEDYANGSDIGVAIFVSGCDLNCNNGVCHGIDLYDFKHGTPFTKETEEMIGKLFEEKPYYGRLTITGGNPTSRDNPKELIPFVKRFKEKFPYVKIWCYSGHTWEELQNMEEAWELVQNCDILVDGRWIPKLRKLSLNFVGSSNQRIIDVKASTKDNVKIYMSNDTKKGGK